MTNFYGFLLGKGFREKCKRIELALNFIQKQYFSPKKPFSFHYSRIKTSRIKKSCFKNLDFLRVLWELNSAQNDEKVRQNCFS